MLFIKLMKSSEFCIKKAQCLLAKNPNSYLTHWSVSYKQENSHLLKVNWEGSRGCSKYD